MKSIKIQLQEVFSNPTAPYREFWVLDYIKKELRNIRVPFYQDQWGNIFAGASTPEKLKKSYRIALVAHTDHPGFHIIKQKSEDRFLAQWHGGHPPKMKHTKVRIYHPFFPELSCGGKILCHPNKKKFFEIQVSRPKFVIDANCFGAFDFPACKFKGRLIETRAADDLAGVAVILSVLKRLPAKALKNFYGIFSTAEETGFQGTMGLLRDGHFGPGQRALSLEASREIEGAKIGLGPIIRLGDRRTLFDNDLIALLDKAAHGKKFQRRIMSGGSCEATAFNLAGVKAAGMAVPLGNYHNQRENGHPGPERIHLKDVEGEVDILVRFYKNLAKTPSISPSKLLFEKLNKEFSEQLFKARPEFKCRENK